MRELQCCGTLIVKPQCCTSEVSRHQLVRTRAEKAGASREFLTQQRAHSFMHLMHHLHVQTNGSDLLFLQSFWRTQYKSCRYITYIIAYKEQSLLNSYRCIAQAVSSPLNACGIIRRLQYP